MQTFFDITIPVDHSIAVWPGDTAYRFDLVWNMEEGASVNVGAIGLSAHTGTHVDAPFHFQPTGATVDALDLSRLMGPVAVIDAVGQSEITKQLFQDVDFQLTPRVLIRTGAWDDHQHFPEAIPILAPDVPRFLGENGVCLLGLDVPSVDHIDSKTLPNHHALASAGIYILESVDLRAVPPGVYSLIALPLRLVGADASPVRAILTVVEKF